MTAKQLANFNRSVDMLYRREYLKCTLEELAVRHGITVQRVGKILTKARFDKRIVAAVDIMHRQMELELGDVRNYV